MSNEFLPIGLSTSSVAYDPAIDADSGSGVGGFDAARLIGVGNLLDNLLATSSYEVAGR